MANLPNAVGAQIQDTYRRRYGLQAVFLDLLGGSRDPRDALSALPGAQRRRDYAMQASLNQGTPYFYEPCPGVLTWVVALEDRRALHGGLAGGEVRTAAADGKSADYLALQGMPRDDAERFLLALPAWPAERAGEAADYLQRTFYRTSGWKPILMEENRLRLRQQEQLSQSVEDLRKQGRGSLYAFEKERFLLAGIRAGDRRGARSILNDMLATIYMSSPQVVVLRARTVELMTSLTRAAIEDNPLMEPLMERNHVWTEALIRARDFEDLSAVLMRALDDFMEGVYLHGANRSNPKVAEALDIVGREFREPLSLSTVAHRIGLSPCRLAHLVKQFTGRPLTDIIHQARIREAQRLLERTSRSCAEIAYEVGFGDQSYFIKHFRRLMGVTPARYRRSRLGPTAVRRAETARP